MVTHDRSAPDAPEIVVPRPAATVVLLRTGTSGLEVLLVERPATMAFAPGLHAFPGGAVDDGDRAPELAELSTWRPDELARAFGGELDPPEALATAVAAIRELFEETGILLADGPFHRDGLADAREALLTGTTTIGPIATFLGIRLRTDLLAPLSRWVTPAPYPRRFDARFYAAELPRGATPSFAAGEVASHRWTTPRAALDGLADGTLQFWPPTSTTLQQLEHLRSFDELVERVGPGVSVERWTDVVADAIVRVPLPAGGGVPGQPVNAYLIGHRELVLVDPGDPGEPAATALAEALSSRQGTLRAIVLTHGDPDHAAGALAAAERWGVPVLVGPGGGLDLPFATVELRDGELLDRVDLPVTALVTPGHRRDHVAFVVDGRDGRAIVAGDLVGPPAERTVVGRPDPAAWRGSLFRLAELGPDLLLPGHGEPIRGSEAVAAAISEAARRAGSGAG